MVSNLPPAPIREGDENIQREEEAFQALHADLRRKYADEFVAIHHGAFVDHDPDQVALYRRTRKDFPGQFVLIAPVHEQAEEIYVFRSPRMNYS